ncbi:MAG: MBL fold metallo-hydrolase [bacterium]|nr:MBL fold metallo-hydrolase [bacterium]
MTLKKELKMEHICDGIHRIDSYYLDREGYASCYLIEENGELAFFETNTNNAVPYLMEAVKRLGYQPEHVKYVILSHIHLDHAGGTGLLMKQLPNAQLVVHARGRRHMINPEKLIEGVKQVYGEEQYHQLYGELLPIDKERVIAIKDAGSITLGERTLEFVDSPGHAKHHMYAYDSRSGSVFSGDAFGIGYPRFVFENFRLVFPSTSPVQFEPEIALQTYQKIVDLKPNRILLTHFGELKDIAAAHDQLKQWIEFSAETAARRYDDGHRDEELYKCLYKNITERFEKRFIEARGSSPTEEEKEFLFIDRDLNAQGVAHYIKKLKESGK